MTDKELIQAYRECKDHTGCVGCPVEHEGVAGCNMIEEFFPDRMIARLEVTAENTASSTVGCSPPIEQKTEQKPSPASPPQWQTSGEA